MSGHQSVSRTGDLKSTAILGGLQAARQDRVTSEKDKRGHMLKCGTSHRASGKWAGLINWNPVRTCDGFQAEIKTFFTEKDAVMKGSKPYAGKKQIIIRPS